MRDTGEEKALAERRRIALAGAAEIVALSADRNRIMSLLALAGGHARLLRAIERAKPRPMPAPRMPKPDAAIWAEAADVMNRNDGKVNDK